MNKLNQIILSVSLLTLTACGGSDSSSSSSTISSAIPKAKQLLCAGQDCVNTNGITSSSLSSAYGNLRQRYVNAKARVSNLNSLVDEFNELSASYGITSCSQLPDNFVLAYDGFGTSNELILSLGDKSFDIGSGSTAMDHKIIRTVNGTPEAEFQFKCVSPTEAYMYVRIGANIAGGVEEAYYHYTANSNVIEYVYKETGADSEMFRFEENSNSLDVSFMSVESISGTIYKSGFKNINIATMPSVYVIELAETSRSGVNITDLDIAFGDHVNGDVRTCLYNPLSSNVLETDPTGTDCDLNGASDLVPSSIPLLGDSGTKLWNETFLGDINFNLID